MEKMLFGSLYAVYRMEIRYAINNSPDSGEENYRSVFAEKWHVNARCEKERDVYVFTLNRSETLLNGKPPEKLMDRIMHEAGSAYYPLSLLVSPRLGIRDVVNFAEVKRRWQECARKLQESTPSPELERYFRFSEKNLADSRTFTAMLYRNAFYNLYFRDIFTPTPKGEVHLIRWENFPEREMNQSYLYQVKPVGENKIHLSGEIMKIVPEHRGIYDSTYETGPLGEIQRISGKIETEWEENRYTKQFSLEAETAKAQKMNAKSLIIDEQENGKEFYH
jgi:hypothetical protein